MTLDDLVEATLQREGTVYAEPPKIDQPTGPGGVTLPTLSAWRNRSCTVEELKALSLDDARSIIRWRLQKDLSLYHFDQIKYEPLRVLLLDTEYNSGEGNAVRWLQALLEVAQDGVLGPRTLTVLNFHSPLLVANAYVALRAHKALTGEAKYVNGLMKRAVEFTVMPKEVR